VETGGYVEWQSLELHKQKFGGLKGAILMNFDEFHYERGLSN
jgi:hypothetical protein